MDKESPIKRKGASAGPPNHQGVPDATIIPKRKVGKPSKYKPEYCDKVIASLSQGRSLAAFAAEMGVHRETIWKWARDHPEFGNACKTAKEASQRWWETLAMAVATGAASNHATYKRANTGMVMFMMSRRFPDYYAKNRNDISDMPRDLPEEEDHGSITEQDLQAEIDRLLEIRERLRAVKARSAQRNF